MIGEQMEHMTKANKDKQIKRKIETSPVLEHRLQHVPLLAFTGGVSAHLLRALEAALGRIGRV